MKLQNAFRASLKNYEEKKVTKFLILAIEGDDADMVRQVGDSISGIVQSVLEVYESGRQFDASITPTIKIHQGNG